MSSYRQGLIPADRPPVTAATIQLPDVAKPSICSARLFSPLQIEALRSPPKDAAADWALQRLPPEHRAVLEHARAIYLGDAAGEWGDLLPRVRPLVDHFLNELESLRAQTTEDAHATAFAHRT